jgi:type I restriction enzyme S subunit
MVMLSIAEFPKYEAYKDSKMTWVLEFPESWRIEKGKWLFSRAERPVRSEDEILTCFRDGVVTLRKNRRTEGFTNAMKEHGYQGIRKGDLVIHAMDAFAGAIGVSDSDGKSTPVYAACVPRNKGEVLPEFYAYFLRDMALSGFVASLAKGIRERSTDFRFNDFADLDLPVPLFEEQRVIAKFLDKKTTQIDEAIAIKEQQIALLKERKQIIIQKAVTQGLDPTVPMKDSGVDWIGEIPAHWEIKKVKNIFRLVMEPSEKNNDHELLSVYTDIGVKPRRELEERGNKASTTDGYWLVKKGDIVVNKLLAWMGAIGLSEYNGVTSPAYDILRPELPLNGYFYHHLFRSEFCSAELKRHSRGIMDMRLRLYFDKFGVIEVPYPSADEQDEIIHALKVKMSEMDEGIDHLKAQIANLKEYKTTLINSAVTGKIRITPDMVEA